MRALIAEVGPGDDLREAAHGVAVTMLSILYREGSFPDPRTLPPSQLVGLVGDMTNRIEATLAKAVHEAVASGTSEVTFANPGLTPKQVLFMAKGYGIPLPAKA